jgi:hypothetical protein
LAEESDAPIYSVDYDTSGRAMILTQEFRCRVGAARFSVCRLPIPGFPGQPAEHHRAITNGAVAYLHALSDTTGGRFYSGDSLFGIAQAFTWIAEELGRQYSLGYYPAKPAKMVNDDR